MTMKVAF